MQFPQQSHRHNRGRNNIKMQIQFETPREAVIYRLALAEGLRRGYAQAVQEWQSVSIRELAEASEKQPIAPTP